MLRSLRLTHKMLLSYLCLLLCMLLLMGGLLLPLRLADAKKTLGSELLNSALILSCSPEVISGLESGGFSPEIIEQLDRTNRLAHASGYVVICDKNSIRLYHPEHWRIGRPFAGGDEAPILAGAEPYTSEAVGTRQHQLRAFQPVKSAGGEILGFVMVSHTMDFIRAAQWRLALQLGAVCLGMLVLGVALAWYMSNNVRRILLGNDPTDFVRMFLQREEILNHLSEGLLVLDEDGLVVYKNAAARSFFPAGELAGEPELTEALAQCLVQCPVENRDVALGGRHCLFSMLPLVQEKPLTMVLLILRDRTDVARLTEQITDYHQIVDALRATTHEFMNKLHVVLGLIQVGRTEEAVRTISSSAQDVQDGYQSVMQKIRDSTVAALVLGKISRARELGLRFNLRADSYLPRDNGCLTTQELITIVGNLVENAFDATGKTWGERQVTLYLGCCVDGLQIVTDDTGCGMSEEQIRTVLSTGFSSKGRGHGYGLRLVRQILEQRNGFIHIDSAPGEGTSVSILVRASAPEQEKGESNDQDNDRGG